MSGNNSDSESFPPGGRDEDSQMTTASDKKDCEKESESRQSNESEDVERSSNPSGLHPLQLVWYESTNATHC